MMEINTADDSSHNMQNGYDLYHECTQSCSV